MFQFYVDGSFTTNHPDRYGWGVAVYENGQLIKELFGVEFDYPDSRQIGGECMACLKALEYARNHKIFEFEIIYDYLGVEKWATREWKAKKPVSSDYAITFDLLKSELKDIARMEGSSVKITFTKVKGHSGVHGNEKADGLANKGISDSLK